jgi:N-dimethylarginine dimethylaminohydrolase
MSFDFGSFNMWGPLKRVALRPLQAAFQSDEQIEREWRPLNYHSRPDRAEALREYAKFEAMLAASGAEIIRLPANANLTMDALYAHDALIVTPKGLVRPWMGKPARREEPMVNGEHLERLGFPILGEIRQPGLIEGGDLIWIERNILLAGIGYRTNREGVAQLRRLIGPDVEIVEFDLPHYKGRADVFHLMSVLSPLDRDLAVVYLPLMPARLVEFLELRNVTFIRVPEAEFPSMGCNVLALGPRRALMIEGNPETERRMRKEGVVVQTFKGDEMCRKGEGGPTCMTRPLVRG